MHLGNDGRWSKTFTQLLLRLSYASSWVFCICIAQLLNKSFQLTTCVFYHESQFLTCCDVDLSCHVPWCSSPSGVIFGVVVRLSILFEISSLLVMNWMEHSMRSVDLEVRVVCPGEQGVAPGFRSFCGVGVSCLTVSSGESCAVSFDDSSSFMSRAGLQA